MQKFWLATLLVASMANGIENHPPYPVAEAPQLPIEVYSEDFAKILGTRPKLIHLARGFGFTEGPVYLAVKDTEEGYLLFTDQINDNILIMRWHGIKPYNQITPLSWSTPVIFRHPSSIADGQTLDLTGRLLTAETTGRRVSITEHDGTNKTLVGLYQGKPFNSPNDLVVKSDGTVWFTDPSYGCLQFPQECYLPNNVYRFDPKTNALQAVIENLRRGPMESPFLPMRKSSMSSTAPRFKHRAPTMKVTPMRSMPSTWLNKGQGLANQRLFATVSPGFPDGMRLDNAGNIYVGALDGVHVLNPSGKLIGKIRMPKETANLSFGGKDNNILFICSSDSIWAIKLNTKGAKDPTVPEISH